MIKMGLDDFSCKVDVRIVWYRDLRGVLSQLSEDKLRL